jgi:hypothetical protein
MNSCARFAYAQARLQARHGLRPDEQLWRRLESIGELTNYLQLARTSVLQPWVAGLSAEPGPHDIELALRQHYRRSVDEVAHWMPPGWGEAVNWVKRLPDLPALQYLLSGAVAPEWLHGDPALRPYAEDSTDARLLALQSSDCSVLLGGWKRGEPLMASWLEHWRSLWPRAPRLAAGLEMLASILRQHLGALSLYTGGASAPLVDALHRDLNTAFRRYSFQPAAAFAHLGLVALDAQKLRAQLLQRALFAGLVTSSP